MSRSRNMSSEQFIVGDAIGKSVPVSPIRGTECNLCYFRGYEFCISNLLSPARIRIKFLHASVI